MSIQYEISIQRVDGKKYWIYRCGDGNISNLRGKKWRYNKFYPAHPVNITEKVMNKPKVGKEIKLAYFEFTIKNIKLKLDNLDDSFTEFFEAAYKGNDYRIWLIIIKRNGVNIWKGYSKYEEIGRASCRERV